MGIKQNTANGLFMVTYSKRHPLTNVPVGAKRINVRSLAEAKRVYNELVIQVEKKIRQKMIPTWDQFVTDYYEHLRTSGISNTTIYNQEAVLRKHTMPYWSNKLVDEIKTPDIYGVLDKNFAGASETHKKYFMKCIRGPFQWALERELVLRNPTPLLKFKIADKIKAVLNEDQIMTLLRRAQDTKWEWYPLYAVAVFTGMRNGELYALTWDKVNIDECKILVNESWSSKDGFKSTKSGDDRVVEIPKPLVPLLQELKLQSASGNFVLPRMIRWDRGEQARDLRLFLKSIGLPEIRFHDLRASWATLLLGKGVPPSMVMAMGGWKDMDTMMIYMRKAGISIKGSTSVLDHIEAHGSQTGKLLAMKPG